MTEGDALARYGLPPAGADLPEIREALAEEAARCRAWQGYEPLLRLYCMMLFSQAELTDILPIRRAKTANWDSFLGVDVQFLCGAGYERTKSYLTTSVEPEAQAALEYLRMCADDFSDWTPAAHLAAWKCYYEVG